MLMCEDFLKVSRIMGQYSVIFAPDLIIKDLIKRT